MASSEPAPIESLTPADLPDCLALSSEAHWNQTEADWRTFFDQGAVWGIRWKGSVVASAALLPYPPDTAWVSMVLTAKRARGRGYATQLAAMAMDESARRGLPPQLDATPEGEPIYSPLGFKTVAQLTRWRRGVGVQAAARAPSSGLSRADVEGICRLDAQAIAFARTNLLRGLIARGPAAIGRDAFALSRDGRSAHHIGPVAAASREDAEAVVGDLLHRLDGANAVIVDASDEARGLAGFLETHGFTPERRFLRMARGTAPRPDFTKYLAAAGPEFG